ncbi:MAG: GNAT family N-acetyltransferase [Chloroflexota bacterium]
MKRVPDINTDRLVLRQVCMEDALDIYNYVRNPNVLRYTTAPPPKQFAETEAFVRSVVNSPDNEFAWSIRIQGELTVIGVIEFSISDELVGSVDYAMDEAYWNRGLMTEAVRAVLDWGFRTCATVNQVRSAAMTANPASTRVQEKCGMTVVRTEYQTWDKFEEPVELSVCAITREAWMTT